MMISYLKKDIRFSKIWLGIAVLYSLICGYIFIKDSGDSFFFVDFLLPLFVTYLPLSRLMNMEDSRDTRDFLRRMPQGRNGRVIARVIFIFSLLIFSFAVKVFYKYLLVKGYSLMSGMNLETELAYFIAFSAFNLISLILFYRFSFHAAQNFTLASYAVVFALGLLNKHTDFTLNFPSVNVAVLAGCGLLLIAALIFAAIRMEKIS